MRVLVCGAGGLIGRHAVTALERAGHAVVHGVHTARPGSGAAAIAMDFTRDLTPEVWRSRLAGIDVVVNVVGIFVEHGEATFERVHEAAPRALFDACVAAGVRRVVQVSALGAADVPFLATKHAADAHLAGLPVEWLVLRPSLVVASEGASSRALRAAASSPVVTLVGRGDQRVQPVAIEDVADAIVGAVETREAGAIVPVVGPAPMSYREMLAGYRRAMGLGRPLWLPVPRGLVVASLGVLRRLRSDAPGPEAVVLLEAGSVAPTEAVTRLIGRAPRPFEDALAATPADALRAEAVLRWADPVLRVSLAIVWFAAAITSAFVWPKEDSLRMLAAVGATGGLAELLLRGAVALDAAFGVLTLARPSRQLWLAQLALVAGYSVIVGAFLPEMLAHPFGPLVKNVPIVAILVVLFALSPSRPDRP